MDSQPRRIAKAFGVDPKLLESVGPGEPVSATVSAEAVEIERLVEEVTRLLGPWPGCLVGTWRLPGDAWLDHVGPGLLNALKVRHLIRPTLDRRGELEGFVMSDLLAELPDLGLALARAWRATRRAPGSLPR